MSFALKSPVFLISDDLLGKLFPQRICKGRSLGKINSYNHLFSFSGRDKICVYPVDCGRIRTFLFSGFECQQRYICILPFGTSGKSYAPVFRRRFSLSCAPIVYCRRLCCSGRLLGVYFVRKCVYERQRRGNVGHLLCSCRVGRQSCFEESVCSVEGRARIVHKCVCIQRYM